MALSQFITPRFSSSSISSSRSSNFSSPSSFSPNTREFIFLSPVLHNFQTPSLSFSKRRLFLTSVSGIWDALTGNSKGRDEAVLAIRRGMLLFRQGDVEGSMEEFDRAIELDPRQKECDSFPSAEFDVHMKMLKLGLSMYLLFRFKEGAEQFRLDVAKNPNDTEESIWCFLCEAQLYGVEEARKQFLEVGRDSRPVMREAYEMFKNGGDPEKFAAEFKGRDDEYYFLTRDDEYFYASLYAGLYYESEKRPDDARVHMVAAWQSPYGQRSEDYMAALAKVHCLRRLWN